MKIFSFRVSFVFLSLFFCMIPIIFAESKIESKFIFLSASDIHFDPFLNCRNRVPCPLIQTLTRTPANRWAEIFSKNKKTYFQYRKNTQYPFLLSSLKAMQKRAQEQHARFVLLEGDYLGHDYRSLYKKFSSDSSFIAYRSFVKKTFEFLSLELKHFFPNTDIYTVLGNNDSYHGDYIAIPNGPFFKDTAIIFSRLINHSQNKKNMLNEFPTGGYYAVTVSTNPPLRLIMLNTLFFSQKVKGEKSAFFANQELSWLEQELKQVKANHQQALLVMHIPISFDLYAGFNIKLLTLIDFWKKSDTKKFKAILKKYGTNVAGILAGHLHTDWFQTYIIDDETHQTIPMIGTPSISPIFGNNPGFKIFTYHPKTHELTDDVIYYYPINNKYDWRVEYETNRLA